MSEKQRIFLLLSLNELCTREIETKNNAFSESWYLSKFFH